VKLEKKWLPELNIGLLPRSEKIEQTEFAHLYERENEQSFLDMLNLFYVGTTRPEDALYILSSQTKEEPKENNSIVALLVSYLKQSSVWHGFTTYTFGDAGFTKATKAKKECSHLYIKEKTEFKNLLASNIQVKMRAELLWSDERTAGIDRGKQLHEALKFVRYRGDEEQAVEKMQAGGGLSESDKKNIIIKLKEITAHPEVAEYFSEGVTVINERALLKNDRKARFPDRIVLQNGSAVIIDYKTGNPLSKYAEQLNEYALLLNEAGIPVSRKIIFYTTAMKAEVLP
jgi:ATP-dependent exoDNAse (exonuclease V) beta subunit